MCDPAVPPTAETNRPGLVFQKLKDSRKRGIMASDISLAVGDGARRMTYVELAEGREISLPSARRLVLRHRWPRQRGNDGIVRVKSL